MKFKAAKAPKTSRSSNRLASLSKTLRPRLSFINVPDSLARGVNCDAYADFKLVWIDCHENSHAFSSHCLQENVLCAGGAEDISLWWNHREPRSYLHQP